MKKIFVSLAAVAALSTAAIAADGPADRNASGAGYEQRIVPTNNAPTGVVLKKSASASEQAIYNLNNQRDKSSD